MLLQQIYDLIIGQIFTIPISNALGAVYTALNVIVLFIVQLLTGGEFSLGSIF